MSQLETLDPATFDRAVLAAPRPVAVLFTAHWCGPCRTLAPMLARLAGELGDAVGWAKVDVDAAPELASRYDVRSLPTLIVVRDGEVVARRVGTSTEGAVRRFVTDAVNDHTSAASCLR